jgi:glycosyltransferase involved in cell wall biosynthesis
MIGNKGAIAIMKISGFTMVRDAIRYDYPAEESIRSLLPLVDEMVVNVGLCQDGTLEMVKSIGGPRIRILERDWGLNEGSRGSVHATETNAALDLCTGDWCFYIQADEVVHEDDLELVRQCCLRNLGDSRVEGLLFDYLHFYATYSTYQTARNWYKHEVRVIRNGIGMQAYRGAQGFRREGQYKPHVVKSGARIFHYGWVREPAKMLAKQKAFDAIYHTPEWVEERYKNAKDIFDYGDLRGLAHYKGTHPAVMQKRIAETTWQPRFEGWFEHKHNSWHIRFLSAIENALFGDRVGGYRNYILVKEKKQ